jgi:hypothetical protein
MIDIIWEDRLVGLLLAEAPEPFDRRVAVGAVHPRATGPPLELGRRRVGAECLPSVEQGLQVDAVVHGVVVRAMCIVLPWMRWHLARFTRPRRAMLRFRSAV